MKKLSALLLTAVLLLALPACAKYSEEDFIGLTSQEIVEKYGPFDHTHNHADSDGLFRNTFCGYIVKDPPSRSGTQWPEYFCIHFDENGVAYSCDYQMGGWGG